MTIIAIDFGTSNTIVSILEADTKQIKTIRLPEISRSFETIDCHSRHNVFVVPTLVFIKEAERLLLGEQVRAERLRLSESNRLFKLFKRDLAADIQSPSRRLNGQIYTSKIVSELFIKEIWQRIQQQQIEPSQVIFTVPVGAFERYLDWFRDLGTRLGVSQIQLVDESTAAALGYAVKHPGSVVLVVDFGGGTLDLSLVRTNFSGDRTDRALKAEVLAKSDACVGGEDIDVWIVEDYLRSIDSSRQTIGEISWQILLEIGERLKIRLSDEPEAKERWFDEKSLTSYELPLSREKFAEILEKQQLFEQLRIALDEVLAIATGKGISKSDIKQVLLVGGSCLIPAVQQLITSYFGANKVKLDKPFEAVCHGALALSQIAEIDDYLRHSYAIRLWEPETKNYSYFTIFEMGIRYPCQREEPIVLQVATEGQTEFYLDIGEVAQIAQAEVLFDRFGRMTSSDLLAQQQYRSLESNHKSVCLARLDPPGERGIDRMELHFEVDRDRVLLATVKDLLTEKILVERQAIAKLS
jgi:molecular chaperone DnaK (HSP70)